MICAIQQPTFFPWIGYFAMIDRVDLFVFLDNVQLVKRGWGVRNKIKNDKGILYLTVPIKKTNSRDKTLATQALIDYREHFIEKHLKSIHFAYGKSPYFDEVFPFIEGCYEAEQIYIAGFNITIIKKICQKIGITTKILQSSEMKGITGHKDDLLISICQKVGATKYLSAESSVDYIERKNPGGAFFNSGIELYYRRYSHPKYPQLFGEFISHLCIIDLLFNIGFDKSKSIITKGKRTPVYYKDLDSRPKFNLLLQ